VDRMRIRVRLPLGGWLGEEEVEGEEHAAGVEAEVIDYSKTFSSCIISIKNESYILKSANEVSGLWLDSRRQHSNKMRA
jgi:hypothetical protein